MSTILYAGCAREIITPEVGGRLEGYSDDNFSESLRDDLTITALALSDGEGQPVLLYSVTICEFGNRYFHEITDAIRARFGIPAENILMSAVHTHSGPNCCGIDGWGDLDRPYYEGIMIPAALKVTEKALAALQPAEFAVVRGQSDIGVNRRQRKLKDDEVMLGQDPYAIQDKEMFMLRFRNAETKKPFFQMICYGCHGTSAGKSTVISRDWIGVMTDRLEALTGILCGFWNGACGDVGPRLTNGKTTGDPSYIAEHGGYAAMEAVRVMEGFRSAVYESGKLTVHPFTLKLPCRPRPSHEEAQAFVDAHSDKEYQNITGATVAYMKNILQQYASGTPAPSEVEQQVTLVTLGDAVAFCPSRFELFSEITIRLRALSPFRHTLTFSLTNGYDAYLPTQGELCRGGYEVKCFLYGMDHPLADNTDSVLVRQYAKELKQIRAELDG